MKYKILRQGMTGFDLSKKSRPPPGTFLPVNMNTQINRILLTIPIRLSAFFADGRIVFPRKIFSKIL